MPPRVALLLGAIFVFFAFRSQRSRSKLVSSALFWPSLWYIVVSSRMVGLWLTMWGVPLPGGSSDPTDGSLIDRSFFLVMTFIGLRTLAKRHFRWGLALRQNSQVVALFVFMGLSVLWSDYSFVSFKRYIKVIGSVVMALVILTEEEPLEAFATVLRRCFYVHLPMSIICIRFFREIGLSWDWNGASISWQGISTTKNVLGQVAMAAGIYFLWEIKRHWSQKSWKNIDVVFFLMALYLLKGSDSAVSLTSLSVFLFALVVFGSLHMFRERPAALRNFSALVFTATASLIALVVTHGIVHFSEDSIFGSIITTFGRDITLTDRAYIWDDVYAAAARSPIVGIGFGGFWIGRMANIPWNENMTWVLGQAHSGYVDTFLQVGIIGVALLVLVIFSTFFRTVRELPYDFEFASLRLTYLLTILFINITESTFLRGDHHLWFLFLTTALVVPSLQRVEPLMEYTDQDIPETSPHPESAT